MFRHNPGLYQKEKECLELQALSLFRWKSELGEGRGQGGAYAPKNRGRNLIRTRPINQRQKKNDERKNLGSCQNSTKCNKGVYVSTLLHPLKKT